MPAFAGFSDEDVRHLTKIFASKQVSLAEPISLNNVIPRIGETPIDNSAYLLNPVRTKKPSPRKTRAHVDRIGMDGLFFIERPYHVHVYGLIPRVSVLPPVMLS